MPDIPKNAKKPSDHKAKEFESDFLTATVAGKEWRIPKNAMDDFELLDDFNALEQRDDPTRLPSVLRRLLGDQWRDAMEAIRDEETGRVSIEAGAEFAGEIMEALDPNS